MRIASIWAVLACSCAPQAPADTPPAPPASANSCEVVPKEHENDESYKKTSADLHANILSGASAGGQLTTEQQRAVNATFQTLPDRNQACAMLTKAYVCLGMANRVALAAALCQSIAAGCSQPGQPSPLSCSTKVQEVNGSDDTTVEGNGNYVVHTVNQ